MYQGRLGVPGDPLDLPVDLVLRDDYLEVRSASGRWSMTDVWVWQLVDGVFMLRLGAEEVHFAADDASSFATEISPRKDSRSAIFTKPATKRRAEGGRHLQSPVHTLKATDTYG